MTFVLTATQSGDKHIFVPEEGVYFSNVRIASWFRESGPISPKRTKRSLLLLWHSYSVAL
jgi:hypothetical protein